MRPQLTAIIVLLSLALVACGQDATPDDTQRFEAAFAWADSDSPPDVAPPGLALLRTHTDVTEVAIGQMVFVLGGFMNQCFGVWAFSYSADDDVSVFSVTDLDVRLDTFAEETFPTVSASLLPERFLVASGRSGSLKGGDYCHDVFIGPTRSNVGGDPVRIEITTYFYGDPIENQYPLGEEEAEEFLEELEIQQEIESYEPCKIAEQFVENRLRAPGTAKFRSGCFDTRSDSGIVSQTGRTFTVRVVVDSENAFGALLRSEFLVTVTHKAGTVTWTLDGLVQTR